MVRGVMLLSVCIAAIAASPLPGRAQVQQQGTVDISVKSTVDKLGLKPSGNLPDEFELSAESNGTVMAIRHRELPAEGVQFHPESVLTESGKLILRNFLET